MKRTILISVDETHKSEIILFQFSQYFDHIHSEIILEPIPYTQAFKSFHIVVSKRCWPTNSVAVIQDFCHHVIKDCDFVRIESELRIIQLRSHRRNYGIFNERSF